MGTTPNLHLDLSLEDSLASTQTQTLGVNEPSNPDAYNEDSDDNDDECDGNDGDDGYAAFCVLLVVVVVLVVVVDAVVLKVGREVGGTAGGSSAFIKLPGS